MRHPTTWLLMGALLIGGAGLACDVAENNTDAPRDNARGRTDNDGAPAVGGSEATGKTDGTGRTMPGGNTIPTQDPDKK